VLEARFAKAILGVPKSTASICAQTELGMKPIRMRIFQQQLRFYFKTLSLPSGRWVKAALLDHLSGLWKSPYIAYICKLRTNLNLQDTPPSLRYLDKHIHHWALARVNEGIRKLQLPCIEPLFDFVQEKYVYSHKYLSSIASFRLSNAGLGNRRQIPGLPRLKVCPLCTDHPLDESHLLFNCRVMKDAQMVLGLSKFKLLCKGDGLDRTCFLYVNGLDSYGNTIPLDEHVRRGGNLQRATSIWLQSFPS